MVGQGPEVRTENGIIRGDLTMDKDVERFRGIPYAVPPVGERRFTNPEPYGEYEGGEYKTL